MSLQGLQPGVPIVNAQGTPTPEFLIYMQQITTGLANSSGASMPAPSPVNIYEDYTGALLSGQLPATVIVQRLLNGVDVSAKCRWFLSTVSGSITATIDQTGLVTITALASSSVLQVKSVRDGVTLYCNVTANVVVGNPPFTGSGGASSSITTFNSTNSTSYSSPITTSDLSVTVGSSGIVDLSAPLTVQTALTAAGTYPVWGKWQWNNAGTWTDVAAEVESSPPCTITAYPPNGNLGEGAGRLSVSASKSGLTAGSTQAFRLMARNDATTGTRAMNFSGTASAVPR